ncbi:MAG: phosphoribosylaminoimidazolecarboxamide formyltransferase [Oscillospiraceae bacterium]|jgi:AICAR transformylase/IMP cyclohydrolase PurH|nr:phosphoribosylaminoimidazolecarboxamide formyltransferase [Oscillospiraceae bacterium]
MQELELKYGCNPNQKPSRIFMDAGAALPLEILNGKPGYINFMDALNGWQLVKELKAATGKVAAASFKHVSPAGAAIGATLLEAYSKARDADPVSSYGDFIALSDKCDAETANYIKTYVSDGVIAPDYEPEALEILKSKRKGSYNVIKIDPGYIPAPIERRHIYGITFEQGRNELEINSTLLQNVVTANKNIPDSAKINLLIALITLKYTQSNSVAYAYDGQAIGIGAGQQSRIACTRLAGDKTDEWFERMKLKQENLAVASDAFFPFADNIERLAKSGVKYIAQPGGSIRDDEVIEACNKYGMAMAFTGIRLFHH